LLPSALFASPLPLPLKLYNVLTRRKEVFKPLRKDWVGFYTCGPTVYNFAHLGNLRTYVFEDLLRRTLEYAGYRVRQVMNITDVEDKIIRDAKKAGKDIFAFVRPYEAAFFADLQKLNIKKAWKYPKATENIPEMIKLIRQLLKKGLAYRADDSIYYDISKFKPYGRLSGFRKNRTTSGSQTANSYHRIDADEYSKKDVQDFVLWKGKKAGEPFWNADLEKGRLAPTGGDKTRSGILPGRPGWHIECSAMSMKYLGPSFDIHAGGVDLIFPHHENEIAQSEGATGKPFVKFFVEGEHLLVNGEKMAKSLGNIFTLRDLETRGFKPLAFRYLVLTSHYRSKLNFSWKSLAAAQNSLERLYNFIRDLEREHDLERGQKRLLTKTVLTNAEKQFRQALFNDLDTPQAVALIWNIVRDYHQNPASFSPKEVLNLLYKFDRVLGLNLKKIKPAKIPTIIKKLTNQREKLRKKGKWKEADALRAKIKKLGYNIEDTTEGPKITPLS